MGSQAFFDQTFNQRFWARTHQTQGCWTWLGQHTRRGYGYVTVHGVRRPATRVAWELAHGRPFPEGMIACHTCDNPPCVKPAHIFLGTQADNIHDALSKGRLVHPNRKRPSVCPNGHPYDELTTGHSRGWRQCRICRRESNRRAYVKARAA